MTDKLPKFRPHEFGNGHLFGVNSFGCNSIISYTEVDGTVGIWKFYCFKNSSTETIFCNANGIRRTFNLTDPEIASRAIRMEEYY